MELPGQPETGSSIVKAGPAGVHRAVLLRCPAALAWAARDADTHMTMQIGPKTGAMPVAEPDKLQFFLGQLRK